MATTMQPETGTKTLVNYRADGGVAVIEMFDPPANTYTYEMNRQLDEAILKAIDDFAIDLVVMGTSARSGLSNLVLGNTAERMISHMKCSVIAVKPHDFECPVRLDD